MDVSDQLGGVLSQPTRARMFALLGELGRSATTDELAERLGLHANGVRLHLERLEQAGLVVRRRERIARGRPRDIWSVSASARPGGDPPTAYADLARWLVRALVSSGAGVGEVEETGRQVGRGIAGGVGDGGDAEGGEQRLFDAIAALGFAPERDPAVADVVVYRLHNCPYRDAVKERQPLVCGLHRGITRGLVDSVDPDTRVVGFEPKDPDLAGCLVRVRGPLAREAGE